jgi:heme/copper-type cytochrome/quinol oxidase subunit 3
MNLIERQQILDEEHLRLLRIGYLIVGGTAAFTGLFGLFYTAMGVFIVVAGKTASSRHGQPPPELMGVIFIAIGALVLLLAVGYASLAFLTARFLKERRARTLCLLTAGISCLYIPFGTVLGAFTFIVMGRPSVRALFNPPPQPPVPTNPRAVPPLPAAGDAAA